MESAYRAPLWLVGRHLQTILPATLIAPARLAYRRERWPTPDGDFVDFDWLDAPGHDAPIVVLFHGLEGGSSSHYARALLAAVRRRGWRGVVPHFRGCSGELNRAPRFYHSGDSLEIDWILGRVRQCFPDATLFAVGVSLGGNALLKWMGESGSDACHRIKAAAAISAPMDLAAGGEALSRGFNRVYTRTFLASLKPKCLAKLDQFPKLFDKEAMLAARDLRAFDNAVTAPLHGFRDTDDYWARASSKPVLPGIAVPTLILNALNDPFLPAASLPKQSDVSKHTLLEYPPTGGHVGFYDAKRESAWLPEKILHFLSERQ